MTSANNIDRKLEYTEIQTKGTNYTQQVSLIKYCPLWSVYYALHHTLHFLRAAKRYCGTTHHHTGDHILSSEWESVCVSVASIVMCPLISKEN